MMNLTDKIIQFGIEHSKGDDYALDTEQYNRKFIEERANHLVEEIGPEPSEDQLAEKAKDILETPEAYHIYKLDAKRQMKLRKKYMGKRYL